MEEQGGMAINFHIHTPICNPSRSELLSGPPHSTHSVATSHPNFRGSSREHNSTLEHGTTLHLQISLIVPSCAVLFCLAAGRYFHNIKTTGGPVWSMHVNEMHVNQATFARNLKEQAGYTCGMFGAD